MQIMTTITTKLICSHCRDKKWVAGTSVYGGQKECPYCIGFPGRIPRFEPIPNEVFRGNDGLGMVEYRRVKRIIGDRIEYWSYVNPEREDLGMLDQAYRQGGWMAWAKQAELVPAEPSGNPGELPDATSGQ